MFLRIRTIKNRRYLYAEIRFRQDGKVRSISRSLGPADGSNRQEWEPGWKLIEGLMEKYPTNQYGHRTLSAEELMEKYPARPVSAASLPTPTPPSEQSPDDAPETEPSSEPGLPSDQE